MVKDVRPPMSGPTRMSRSVGKGKGGYGDSVATNEPSKRMSTTVPKGPSGNGDNRPPAKGPGRAPRSDKGKISHEGGKGYAV